MPENEQNENVAPLAVRVQNVEQAKAFDNMGVIVTWTKNGEANLESIEAAFAKVGMQDIAPKRRETKQALRAALASRFSKKNRRVAPAGDGYEVLIEHPIEGARRVKQEHVISCWIEADENGHESIVTDAPSFEVENMIHSVNDICAWVEEAKRRVDSDAISSALVEAGRKLNGIAIRDGGGAYWLPRGSIGRWMSLVEGLNAAGRPMVMGSWTTSATSVSIQSTIDSVGAHVDRKCDELLASITSGSLGLRALDTKTNEAMELVAQLTEYEKVLGQGLENLKAKVLDVKTASVQAAMVAHAAKEERLRSAAMSRYYDDQQTA